MLENIQEINSERGRDYDHPLPNFLRISLLWSTYCTPFQFNPIMVADLMILLKEGRVIKTPKWDNYIDIIGYTNCIDMMCEMYYAIECLGSEQEYHKTYTSLAETAKEAIVNELRCLSFNEQYDLLCKCIEIGAKASDLTIPSSPTGE